jgi:hypothetical protein
MKEKCAKSNGVFQQPVRPGMFEATGKPNTMPSREFCQLVAANLI